MKNRIHEMFPIGDALGRRILLDPISAVIGGAGIVTNLIGAKKGANAANQAAALQSQAAQQAGQQVKDAAAAVNPQITNSAYKAGEDAKTAAAQAGAGVASATDRANNLLDPYRVAGEDASSALQNGLAAGGDFNKAPTLKDLQIDPGYQFRLDQGQKTLERSAFARGNGISGTAGMDLVNYSQGAASQEYQNAFNRFRQSTQDRFNNLNTVAGRGRDVAGVEGSNLIGSGKYSGDVMDQATQYGGGLNFDASKATANNTLSAADQAANYLTQGANAQAAGKVGAANAWSAGLGGAASSAGAAYGLHLQGQQNSNMLNLLRNPAAAPREAMGPPPAAPTTTGYLKQF